MNAISKIASLDSGFSAVDSKALEALIDMCRAKGVANLKWEGVEISLGTLPTKAADPVVNDVMANARVCRCGHATWHHTPQGECKLSIDCVCQAQPGKDK